MNQFLSNIKLEGNNIFFQSILTFTSLLSYYYYKTYKVTNFGISNTMKIVLVMNSVQEMSLQHKAQQKMKNMIK